MFDFMIDYTWQGLQSKYIICYNYCKMCYSGGMAMASTYENRGYLLDDYRLFHLSEPQKGKIEYHYHEFCKLLLLRSGSGGYWVEGQRYSLQPGDLVLIGSHCVHKPDFEADAPYERIILYISPEFLRRQSAPDCDLEAVFSGNRGHILRPEEETRRKLAQLVSRLERGLSEDGYGRVILCNGMLLRLLVEIGREQECHTAVQPGPLTPQSKRILEILRHIEAHLAEDIGIDALAQRFYISKYHMMRLFRQETGQSIHDYVTDRRLLRARELMAQGISATESCYLSGFRTYSSFTRAYGRKFGTTPTGRSSRWEETYE